MGKRVMQSVCVWRGEGGGTGCHAVRGGVRRRSAHVWEGRKGGTCEVDKETKPRVPVVRTPREPPERSHLLFPLQHCHNHWEASCRLARDSPLAGRRKLAGRRQEAGEGGLDERGRGLRVIRVSCVRGGRRKLNRCTCSGIPGVPRLLASLLVTPFTHH